MKTRFHTLDIRAIVKNLQSIVGLRVANVYDLNHRTYLIKLAKPDHKAFLLIESGTRIHTTDFTRDKSDVPSVFSLKLRKFLKTKRLESVAQVGVDRVVVLTFGSGPATQYLILEMYAQGNIILTDGSYTIQALLRPYKLNDDVIVAVNQVYPMQTAKTFVPLTIERLQEILASAQKKDTLPQLLTKHLDFGPELVEHCILAAKLNPHLNMDNWKNEDLNALFASLQEGERLFETFTKENSMGYIVLREPKQQQQQQAQQAQQAQQPPPEVFDEVIPYQFLQYANRKLKPFPTFDAALDIFFSQAEGQKAEVQKTTAESAVQKKIEKFKAEHNKRISSLQQAEASNERKARLIEANLQEVEQCLAVVRSALGSGMDWGELATLVKDEKKKNPHSVANLIHRLVLDKNTVTLLLSDPLEDYDEDSDEDSSDEEGSDDSKKGKGKAPNITRAPELVDVDIGMSAFANATKYYDLKKQSTQKAQKTVDKTEQALKAAERKSRKALAEAKTKQGIMLARKPFWFEKFFWFISSENYLILYGRDAQQNEQLYKKYLDKDDIYVHADIHGAATCVIKNKSGGGPIPPQTLSQAGCMCVCLSNAWQAKIITSAWWVYAHQVSKTAPTGEYLTTGSFMIRGKKNFLPPSQLVVGFAFMFRVDDESAVRHQGERKVHAVEETGSTETAEQPQSTEDQPKEGGAQGEEKAQKPKKERKKLTLPEDDEEGGDGVDLDITKYKVSLVPTNPEDLGQDDDETSPSPSPGTPSEPGGKQSKKRISAKERRMLKKGKQTPSGANDAAPNGKSDNSQEESEGEETRKEGEATDSSQPTTTTTTTSTDAKDTNNNNNDTKPPKESNKDSGKKANNNKEKGKPEDKGKGKGKSQQQVQQPAKSGKKKGKGKGKFDEDALDEEEMQARMMLLGVKKSQPKEDKSKDKDKKKGDNKGNGKNVEKGKGGEKKPANKPQEKQIQKEPDKPAASASSAQPADPSQPQGEAVAAKPTEEGEKEYSELMKENGEEDDSDSDKEETKGNAAPANDINLDSLIGTPLDGDVLLHAIPVIAPYSVVANFKFRVKVTPGHTKRGKAAKAAQEALFRQPSATQREKDLIRAVPLEELSRAMLANVKLHAPMAARKAVKDKAGKDVDFEVAYEEDDK